MSRVGQNPVMVPSGVDVQIAGQVLTVKGKMGELTAKLANEVEVTREDDKLIVRPRNQSRRARTLWGTSRAQVNNLVVGVTEGFTRTLEIVGVGYRAAVEGKTLNLQLGYSHEINYPIPDGITIACERPTLIEITGADRQQVGQIASEIRAYRKPEPYKGKGVRYNDEMVYRKEGKKK